MPTKKNAKKTAPKPSPSTKKSGAASKATKKVKSTSTSPDKNMTASKKTKPTKAAKSATTEKVIPVAQKKEKPEIVHTEEKTKALVLSARKRTGTPVIFKKAKSKVAPVAFTMDDVNEVLATRNKEEKPTAKKTVEPPVPATQPTEPEKPAKKAVVEEVVTQNRNHTAASITDILGFNPAQQKARQTEENVPKKWLRYYKALVELREHVRSGLDMHTADTLMRSGNDIIKDGGKDMVDASSDSFDRDFALNLVSSEQEALYEIEEAIQRIFNGTYGICEITQTPIDKERLEAVPFTRYSLEGQRELEKMKRNRNNRTSTGVFADAEDGIAFGEEDDSDT